MKRSEQVISKMVEVKFNDEDGFRKVKETLTRLGVPSRVENTLYQSVHILHKQGHYYLAHFKEMFMLDGKYANLTEEDIKRRNMIAKLLEDWNLIEVVSEENMEPQGYPSLVKIIKYSDKEDWNLVSKYSMGVKK